MVVEFFEVVVDGCRWLQAVLGGFRWLQVVPSFSNYGKLVLNKSTKPATDYLARICLNHCLVIGTLPYGHLCITVNSLLRPIFLSRKNSSTCSLKKKKTLLKPTVTFQNRKQYRILYNYTPLIRRIVLNVENQGFRDRSILSIIVIYLVVKQPIYFTTLL